MIDTLKDFMSWECTPTGVGFSIKGSLGDVCSSIRIPYRHWDELSDDRAKLKYLLVACEVVYGDIAHWFTKKP